MNDASDELTMLVQKTSNHTLFIDGKCPVDINKYIKELYIEGLDESTTYIVRNFGYNEEMKYFFHLGTENGIFLAFQNIQEEGKVVNFDNGIIYIKAVFQNLDEVTSQLIYRNEDITKYIIGNKCKDIEYSPTIKSYVYSETNDENIDKLNSSCETSYEYASALNKIDDEDYTDITSSLGMILQKYVKRDDGSLVSEKNSQALDYVDISKLKNVYISGITALSAALYAVFSDDYTLLITKDRGTKTSYVATRDKFPYEEIIKTYHNAKYVRLSSYINPLKIESVTQEYCRDVVKTLRDTSLIETEELNDITTEITTIHNGGYINRNTGQIVQYDGCYYSDYINIEELEKKYITATAFYSVSLYCGYDEDNNLLFSVDRGTDTSKILSHEAFPYSDILTNYPATVTIRFSSYSQQFIIEKKTTKSIDVVVESLLQSVSELHVSELPSKVANNLYGKKIVAIGDSMTLGHTLSDANGQTWLAKIAIRNNMTRVNYGLNGCSLSYIDRDETNPSYNHTKEYSVVGRYSEMDDDADYIIVFAGTNDMFHPNNYPIGNVDDTDKSASFCGSLNVLCDGLITKYPTKKIAFITPYYYPMTESTASYIEAIENVCAKYGIPVFNNKKNGGICYSNIAQKSALTMTNNLPHLVEDGMTYASYKYEAFLRML